MVTWWHWHTEPLLIGSLLFAGWCYAILVGPLRQSLGGPPAFPRAQAGWFAAGLILFYLAVGSPLDPLGESFLFSAHMVQHNLLMYAVPRLLLAGLPVWLADAWLSRCPHQKAFWRFLTHPVVAGLLFTGAFSVWHFPVLYEAALTHRTIHVLEHLTMFLPALLVWWVLGYPSSQVPPLAYGPRILYIFLLTVGQVPVFAFLVFASGPLYPTYEYAPRVTALDPLQDQVLGGLLMKVNGMIVALLVMGTSFLGWYRAETPGSFRPPSHPRS